MNKGLENIKIGSLTIITGAMFAGKTGLLIEKYNQLKNFRKCLVFKPVIDKRYSSNNIVSHQGEKISAIPITNIQEIENYKNQVENIFIDEIHFFKSDIVPYLEELAKQNKEVIVVGLDWNYFENKPFPTTADLLATAEKVVKLWVQCQIGDCQEKATKSQWKLTKLPEKPEDYVGGAEKYGSYCRWHYVPINKLEKNPARYNNVGRENARAVIWKGEEFLMVYDVGKGWNLPGGMIEKGETPAECAIREIREETNLTINNLELLCAEWIYYRDKWWKTHLFETKYFSGKIIKQNSEVSDIKFFTYQQANELTSKAIETFLPHVLKSLQRHNIIKRIITMNSQTKFTTNYVRQSWLDIFQQKGYHPLKSASLIPQNDPSLLWINSGVATLKKYFNNPNLAPARNLVNCQRVIRTDDLANINAQSYHQTLFEMLGDFSIGSNFKSEVIPIIWEWFTSPKWLNMNPQNLFITVWENDKVSLEVWKKQGVKENHILFGSKKTNFWDMGDGPCGPNTEIYFDFHGEKELPKNIEELDNKRFIEICNVVFPEFYHKGKEYLPLAEKCVDTGAGLERITMVLQEKKNTFEIDLWEPVIKLIESYCQQKSEK